MVARTSIFAAACGLLLGLSASAANADEALTARNKDVVRQFYTTVFLGRNVDAAPRFLAPGYIQHNPHVRTGLKGFMEDFKPHFAEKMPADYKREILRIVGDNDIVVLYNRQWWTSPKDHLHHTYLQFDMFRVKDGMITEHWDADS